MFTLLVFKTHFRNIINDHNNVQSVQKYTTLLAMIAILAIQSPEQNLIQQSPLSNFEIIFSNNC